MVLKLPALRCAQHGFQQLLHLWSAFCNPNDNIAEFYIVSRGLRQYLVLRMRTDRRKRVVYRPQVLESSRYLWHDWLLLAEGAGILTHHLVLIWMPALALSYCVCRCFLSTIAWHHYCCHFLGCFCQVLMLFYYCSGITAVQWREFSLNLLHTCQIRPSAVSRLSVRPIFIPSSSSVFNGTPTSSPSTQYSHNSLRDCCCPGSIKNHDPQPISSASVAIPILYLLIGSLLILLLFATTPPWRTRPAHKQ